MKGRRIQIVVLLVIFLFLFCPSAWAGQNRLSEDERFALMIQKVKPSVVCVGSYYFNDVPKNRFQGTGFAINDGRLIVTNYHVVAGIVKQKRLPYLKIFHKIFPKKGIKARLLASDKFHDLAILGHEGKPLPVMKLADSSKVKEGYKIAFTGYPIGFVLGLSPTTHTGIISGITPIIKPSPSAKIIDGSLIKHLHNPFKVLQIDAVAFPGNSGSPVYRIATGEIVGVINMVFVKGKKEHAITKPSGITYAIPSKFIIELAKKIKQPD